MDDLDFKNNPMTKEEFLAGVQELVRDMEDPHGNFAMFSNESREIIDEVRRFDPAMAQKFETVYAAYNDLASYIKSRGELLTDDSTMGG